MLARFDLMLNLPYIVNLQPLVEIWLIMHILFIHLLLTFQKMRIFGRSMKMKCLIRPQNII